MSEHPLSEDLIAHLPHGQGFKFVEAVDEIDDDHVVARYRFKVDEPFYRDHFPGNPVTPGVILVEAMAQTGLNILGIHIEKMRGMFIFVLADNISFNSPVLPGTEVIIKGKKKKYERGILTSQVALFTDNRLACKGLLTGKHIEKPQDFLGDKK